MNGGDDDDDMNGGDDDDDMNGGNRTATCTFQVNNGDNRSAGECTVDGESVNLPASRCDVNGQMTAGELNVGDTLDCEIGQGMDRADFDCTVTKVDSISQMPDRDLVTIACNAATNP